MFFTRWIRGMCYSGYDRRGNAKYLLGRADEPAQCDLDGVPPAIRDEALLMLCDSFDIPERQMYCLRPDDELMAIYQSFIGPRYWDDMEFERLGMALEKLLGTEISQSEFESIRSVRDLIYFVDARRGVDASVSRYNPVL